MDTILLLTQLSSYFELMAALNAAFIVSDEFGKKLILNVFRVWPNQIKKDLLEAKQFEEDCSELNSQFPGSIFSKELGDLTTKLNDLQTSHDEFVKNLDQNKFNLVSTCAFTYCVFVLLLIGFGLDKVYWTNTFLIYNVVSLTFLLFYVLVKKQNKWYTPVSTPFLGLEINWLFKHIDFVLKSY